MMTRISSPDHQHTVSSSKSCEEPICISWRLYDNPRYHHSLPHPQPKTLIWDLNFAKAFMESELKAARTQIVELKAELEYERKTRKRAETTNKKLSKDLENERRGREALEMEYNRLFRESSSDKSDIHRLKREIEEERKMHRLAEVLREERVQMKLADARLFLEEKLSELQKTESSEPMNKLQEETAIKLGRVSSSERRNCDVSNWNLQKRSSPEAENPHIRRGIMGFVEFLKVIMRAIRSKSGHWGSKIKCQRAQLKILLRQNTAPRSNSFVSG
ncbi:PREDICTED: protein BRANCHLESS TRICHOME [Tarenaya hassleriana]|uniref:protein BRANCHLESS TRICHOME n=1 Tax=Tarenaya hassleriana TaxID=28532 RepID=UPI00053C4F81|nr:PREDICTED: protein BRANCHLESS TRICHOME [Tarenaya hassleriana]